MKKIVTLMMKFLPWPGPGQVGPVCAGTPTLEMQKISIGRGKKYVRTTTLNVAFPEFGCSQ